MQLAKIVLHGFKSFADRIVVDMSQGVTAVVGPNGCGKSNIVDAVRWVFGEKSAKSLRGNKMKDVIFGGTAKRKAMNFAEVQLHFEGVGDVLDVEEDRVVVGRKLWKSGESEYRINGEVVRARDVQDLFWDSGLGKDAFAIFEQGRIDSVILCSPEERRPIFDQAAGILRFRQRRKETLRRLEQTEANLSRIGDVMEEVHSRVAVLEKQVVEARDYKKNRAEMEALERGLIATRWRNAEKSRKELDARLASVGEKLVRLESKRSGEEDRQREVQTTLEEREAAWSAAREKLYQARSLCEVRRVEKEALLERIRRLEEELQSDEVEQLKEREKGRKEALDECGKRLAELRPKLKEAEKRLQASIKERTALSSRVEKLRANAQELRSLREARVAEVHRLERAVGEAELQLGNLQGQIERLEAEQGSSQVEECRRVLEERCDALAACDEAGAREALETVVGELETQQARLEKSKARLAEVAAESADIKGRMRVLESLKESLEGTSSGVKRLIRELGIGLLSDVVEVPSGEEERAGVALSRYAQTLLVENEEQLGRLVELSAKRGVVDFSVAVRSLMRKGWEKECIEELEEQDGLLRDGNGVLFAPGKREANVFLRDAELKVLKGDLKGLGSEQRRLETESGKLSGTLEELGRQRRERESLLREVERRAAGLRVGVEEGEAQLGRLQAREKQVAAELVELRRRRTGLEKDLAGWVRKAQGAEQGDEGERLEAVERQLGGELERLQAGEEAMREQEEAYRQLLTGREHLEAEVRLVGAQIEEGARRRGELLERRKAAAGEAKELRVREKEIDEKGAERERIRCEKGCDALEKEVLKWREKLEQVSGDASDHYKAKHRLEEEAHALEVSIGQRGATAEALEKEMEERFGMECAECEETVGKIDEAERKIRELRGALERAGQVNLAAVEEYEEIQGRHAKMEAQVDDLESTRDELMEILGDLDRASRERFVESFAAIAENFQKQFQVLFQGGEAELKLVGSNDPLEAGIEIAAKPPGKKMRSIGLLSGGEKCMTAMALLFAIFEVKPAPFCILDEMDAPLDDANIARFIEVLRPFMERTQFIIITHNKRTMAVADLLHGISMEERGVSKMIALKFAKAAV